VINEKNRHLTDLSVRERWVIWPTVAMAIFMGVFPKFFLAPMEHSVGRMVQRMQVGAAVTSVRNDKSDSPKVRKSESRSVQISESPKVRKSEGPKVSAVQSSTLGLSDSRTLGRR
jgi:hypothetical protein